jgi:hypothetical protein
MKFSAPIKDAAQKIAMLATQTLARSSGLQRAQRRISSPPVKWRATAHKECRQHDHKGDEGRPKGKHIQNRERHVGGADLNRQKVVAESALWRRGQHEEHHDGAVHRKQTQICFGLNVADHRQVRVRPDQVNPHEQRQEHAHPHCGQRQEEVLDTDDLMIETKDVFPNEALEGRMRVNHFRGSHYCLSASRAAIHLSKSSWLTTFNMPCIL